MRGMTLVAALSALVGCSNASTSPTVIYRGGETPRAEVETAARAWDRCGASIRAVAPGEPGADDPDLELVETKTYPQWEGVAVMGVTRRDMFGAPTRVEFVRHSAHPESPTAGVIAHELGHVIGGHHLADDQDGLLLDHGWGYDHTEATDEDCATLGD